MNRSIRLARGDVPGSLEWREEVPARGLWSSGIAAISKEQREQGDGSVPVEAYGECHDVGYFACCRCQKTIQWVTTWKGGSALRDDGVSLGRCDRDLLLAYRRHPKIAPHLAGVHLGRTEEEAREWLVMDTLRHLLYVAPPEEARRHLAEQWPRYQEQTLEYTPEELAHLLSGLEGTSSDQSARRAEALRESQANYIWMLQRLDAQGGPSA